MRGVPTTLDLAGCRIHLTFENLQYTASFKERGACNKLLLLTEEERARGVIATSAGNHAQGVAYHAQRMGIHAEIVMPRFTPMMKVDRTRAWCRSGSLWRAIGRGALTRC